MTDVVTDSEDSPSLTPLAGAPPLEAQPANRLQLEKALPCGADELTTLLARTLARALESGGAPFAHFRECRRVEDVCELVVFEVEVELAQRAVHDIRHREPVAVLVSLTDPDAAPDVLALRGDFPLVPHTNLRSYVYPKSLCLYDVAFRDIESQWTPARFIRSIRDWLRDTARGELHASDQPLEPLLLGGEGWLILPAALRDQAFTHVGEQTRVAEADYAVYRVDDHRGRIVLIGGGDADVADVDAARRVATVVIQVRPRTHGLIQHAPNSLRGLQAVLEPGGDDVIDALRRVLTESEVTPRLHELFALVLLVPMRREEAGEVERIESWAFCSARTVLELGASLGIWAIHEGTRAMLLGSGVDKDCPDFALAPLNVVYRATRDSLARFNGRPRTDERCIVAVGGGALGSQVMFNAARAGFGRWVMVDNDILLPHNVARHVLPGAAVAHPKAQALATIANGFADDGAVHEGVTADVLAPGSAAPTLQKALNKADLVVDMSASMTVARALSRDINSEARRISVFLSPSGHDLILIAEDADREVRLDALEMQLYRALGSDDSLRTVHEGALSRVRYGRSCRDVSSQIPQALVATHAGIASMALPEVATRTAPAVMVWRLVPETLGVTAHNVPVSPVREVTLGDWRLVTDEGLLSRVHAERTHKLPRETGGVLLGAYDFRRKIVYVADAIPSPPDSREEPTGYQRGTEGLTEAIEKVREATADQLHYIGEWHSHPSGHPCHPSPLDRTLFAWIAEATRADGLPPLMWILGDGGVTVPYLGELEEGGEYPAVLLCQA